MRFKRGDKVKYVSGNFGDATHNPLWGGKNGKIIGTVISINDTPGWIKVKWSNGERNDYHERDLEKLSITIKESKSMDKTQKEINFILVYDTPDEDPIEYFRTKGEVIKRINKLLESGEIMIESAKLYEVKSCKKVTLTVDFK